MKYLHNQVGKKNMLTAAGLEPAISWSEVRRLIRLGHAADAFWSFRSYYMNKVKKKSHFSWLLVSLKSLWTSTRWRSSIYCIFFDPGPVWNYSARNIWNSGILQHIIMNNHTNNSNVAVISVDRCHETVISLHPGYMERSLLISWLWLWCQKPRNRIEIVRNHTWPRGIIQPYTLFHNLFIIMLVGFIEK